MYMATVTIVPEIVPNDCFLRKLPVGLSLVQRMQFDALRIAADMIGLANWRLVSIDTCTLSRRSSHRHWPLLAPVSRNVERNHLP